MHFSVSLSLSDESERYMDACARIRRISRTRLIERLLKLVADDQMVLGILDDESKPWPWLPGELTKSHFRKHEKSET